MKIYDVTVAVSDRTPIYAGDPPVRIDLCKAIAGGDAANVSQICMGVHTATHVDAPNHFIEGASRVHELPLDALVGNCRVVEIPRDVRAIDAKMVAACDLEGATRVLFKTRNSAFWDDPASGFRADFTYLSPEAARVLVE